MGHMKYVHSAIVKLSILHTLNIWNNYVLCMLFDTTSPSDAVSVLDPVNDHASTSSH